MKELNRKGEKTEIDKARIFLLTKTIEELETLLKTIKNGKKEKVIITPHGTKAWYLENPPGEELEKIGTFVDKKRKKSLELYVWKPKGLITEVNKLQITYIGNISRLSLLPLGKIIFVILLIAVEVLILSP